VKTPTNVLALNVSPSDTIRDVKYQIQQRTGTQCDIQSLVFCGKNLTDDMTIKGMGIEKQSTLYLVVRLSPNQFRISVQFSSGRNLYIVGENSEIIDNIKSKVQHKTGILKEKQKLFYAGKMLNENNSLQTYNITPDSSLKLELQQTSKRTRNFQEGTNQDVNSSTSDEI